MIERDKSETINFKVTKQTKKLLANESKKFDTTISRVLRHIVDLYFESSEGKDD
jgi:hypothetical protein